jgi:hypothetical protein
VQEGSNNDVRGDLDAAIVEQRILADIQSLVAASHILPRLPQSGRRAPSGIPIDRSWYLTRDDLDKVKQYVRRDAQSKKDFLLELDEWRSSGRYTLAQAADVIEAEAGERYESILFLHD